MAKPEALFDQRTIRHHTAILLVANVDRRILPALRFLSRLPQTDIRAVHLSIDPEQTTQLAIDWMNLDLTWLPLHIHEPAAATLPASVRQAIEQEAPDKGSLTVVVPELDFCRWWHAVLHRRSARRIARELQALHRVTTVIVPFSTPLPKAAPG